MKKMENSRGKPEQESVYNNSQIDGNHNVEDSSTTDTELRMIWKGPDLSLSEIKISSEDLAQHSRTNEDHHSSLESARSITLTYAELLALQGDIESILNNPSKSDFKTCLKIGSLELYVEINQTDFQIEKEMREAFKDLCSLNLYDLELAPLWTDPKPNKNAILAKKQEKINNLKYQLQLERDEFEEEQAKFQQERKEFQREKERNALLINSIATDAEVMLSKNFERVNSEISDIESKLSCACDAEKEKLNFQLSRSKTQLSGIRTQKSITSTLKTSNSIRNTMKKIKDVWECELDNFSKQVVC